MLTLISQTKLSDISTSLNGEETCKTTSQYKFSDRQGPGLHNLGRRDKKGSTFPSTRAANYLISSEGRIMRKQAFPVAFGVVFSIVFAASTALADTVRSVELDSLNGLEQRTLHIPDFSRAEEVGYLFAGTQSNNGKHLGFSAAAIHAGPRLGIVRPTAPSVSQNPEPATMILFGTGLAAVGAAFRRRRKA
jgi:hypothetical protein